jgi:hypothetical protein
MAKATKQSFTPEERFEWILKQKAQGLTNKQMFPSYAKIFGKPKIQSLHDDIHKLNKMGRTPAKMTVHVDTSKLNNLNTRNLELGEVMKNLPMPAWGNGPNVRYPNQYKKIQAMEVGNALVFPTTKEYMAMINAIRTSLKKTEGKIYDVRKIDDKNSGIWRRPEKVKKRIGRAASNDGEPAKQEG